MKKISIIILLLSVLFSSCEKPEIRQDALFGTLKGEIYCYDEFFNQLEDKSGVLVSLEGSDPLLSCITDTNGKYVINDIPSGTYNLVLTKEGCPGRQIQGFSIIGGEVPVYYDTYISEMHGTRIEDISVEYVVTNHLKLTGTVYHNYPNAAISYPRPSIRYFINSTGNPSNTDFIFTGRDHISANSGDTGQANVIFGSEYFPSGTTIFIRAYGCGSSDYGYYDILTNNFIYTDLGTPSNVTSFIIP